jgi:hypothetical protein
MARQWEPKMRVSCLPRTLDGFSLRIWMLEHWRVIQSM